MRYNNNRKPVRLMFWIGGLKLFFSFDPEYLLCERCHWRRARHHHEIKVDAGSRKDEINSYCNACESKLFG